MNRFLKAAMHVYDGKRHVGSLEGEVPNDRGFDEFRGFLGGAHPYWVTASSKMMHKERPDEKCSHKDTKAPRKKAGNTHDFATVASCLCVRSSFNRIMFDSVRLWKVD